MYCFFAVFDFSGLRRSEYIDSSDAVKTAWTQFDDTTLESRRESSTPPTTLESITDDALTLTTDKPPTLQPHQENEARKGKDANSVFIVMNPMPPQRNRGSIESPLPDVYERNADGSDGADMILNSNSRRSWRRVTEL